jgi:hypothetical protein
MSNLRTGINVSRRIGAGGGANITEELRQVRTQGTMPIFQIAVAAEIYYNPNVLTDDDKTTLAETVANPRAIAGMPRNSILARVVSNGNDIADPRPRIIYPFFQSHFSLPLKAGEQVFVVYPDPHLDGHEQGYWVTRVPEPATVEDLNFTHGDRRYDQTLNQDNQSTSDRAEGGSGGDNSDPPVPSFPNGANTPGTLTLFVSGTNDHPYETIFSGSYSNKQVTFEAIPRFIKRPADFALIGSNNARLIIGEDRTGPATRVSESNQKTDKVGKAGTIDIVAGVGGIRHLPDTKDDDPTQTDPDKRPTAPHVIENSRHKKEVNKVPFLYQKHDNPKEGDPDFKRDMSRIYVSMKTAGDKNFNIKITGDGGLFTALSDKAFPAIKDALDPALADGDEDGQPFIVMKSEHVRVIAAGKDKEEAYGGPTEHGDIRLIKEGNVDDKDLSMIVMDKAGNILQLAKNIQLLTHDEGKIMVKCKDGEEGNSDPMILYSKLKITLDNIIDAIGKLADKVGDQFNNIASQGITAPNAAGPFSPIPGLIGAKLQCTMAKQNLTMFKTQTIDQMKSDNGDNAKIQDIRSKWIFINKDSMAD